VKDQKTGEDYGRMQKKNGKRLRDEKQGGKG
jgi:hypothetical protein